MFIQGQYGLEFDTQESGSGFHAGWLLALLPVAAIVFLIVRGCGGKPARPEPADPAQGERYDQPEASGPARERFTWKSVGQLLPSGHAGKQAAAKPSASSARQPAPSGLPPRAGAAAETPAAERIGLLRQLHDPAADPFLPAIERRLAEINLDLLLADGPFPGKARIKIVPGDSVARIAKRAGCTEEYILRANAIGDPSQLRPGHSLWTLDHPAFVAFASLKKSDLTLTLNGTFFKHYPLDVSLSGIPAGQYLVRSRGRNETASGESGTCWLTLRPAGEKMVKPYGLYSNPSPAKDADFPGVFLPPADVAELHLLLPAGTPVIVF